MWNKLCGSTLKGSELREISATLKEMLEEMRRGKEPKKYEQDFVPITVEKIGKTVEEIEKRTKEQGKFSRGIFIYQIGLTMGVGGYAIIASGATQARLVGGVLLLVAGTYFGIMSLKIFSEFKQRE
jgi:hypothetical protein